MGDFFIWDDEDIYINIGFNDAETIEITTNWYNIDHLVYTDWVMLTFILEQIDATNITYNTYIDGVKDTQASGGGTRLLASIDSATEYINEGNIGSLDDFMIFNKALTPSEITQLYNQANTQMQLNTTGEKLFSRTGV